MDKKLLAVRNDFYTQKIGVIFTALAFGMVILGCLVGFNYQMNS